MELSIIFILVILAELLFIFHKNKKKSKNENTVTISRSINKPENSHKEFWNLIYAIRNNDINEVQKIINLGFDLNYNHGGYNALLCAIDNGNVSIVKILLQYGSSVNDVWYYDEDCPITPLFYVINLSIKYEAKDLFSCIDPIHITSDEEVKKRLEIADILINKGADLNNKWIQHLLSHALSEKSKKVYEFLFDKNVKATEDALNSAIYTGNYEAVKKLLKRGANPKIKIKSYNFEKYIYYYPISSIVQAYTQVNKKTIFDIITLLLDYGANINHVGDLMATAITSNDIDTLNFLINKGIDLNVYGADFLCGGTPLCVAICNNNKNILELLIQNGADVNYYCENSDTALFCAIDNNSEEFVSILLRAGADPRLSNEDGIDAYQYARESGSDKIINLLEEHKYFLRENSKKFPEKKLNNLWIENSADNKELREIIKKRDINNLVHFTHLDNLDSILKYGIIPNNLHNHLQTQIKYNDNLRLDNRTDTVSISITFPNDKMFYKYRMLDSSQKNFWCVLLLKPDILIDKNCLFCPTNAASNSVRFASSDQLRGVKAFEAMFGNSVARNEIGLPKNWPTDVQAEVMVCDIIEPQYIKKILLDDDLLVSFYQQSYSNFTFIRDHRYFSNRDYVLFHSQK